VGCKSDLDIEVPTDEILIFAKAVIPLNKKIVAAD